MYIYIYIYIYMYMCTYIYKCIYQIFSAAQKHAVSNGVLQKSKYSNVSTDHNMYVYRNVSTDHNMYVYRNVSTDLKWSSTDTAISH
jgi:hypothetical protein